MLSRRHGISIGIERHGSEFLLSLKVVGKLTHDDYQIITPMIESAIAGVEEPRINLFIDCSEFDGWELRAAWDDLKLGIKHNKAFSKIALYGKQKWQKRITKVGSWFISGDMKFFENSNEAIDWLL